jgi:hypothetical protein
MRLRSLVFAALGGAFVLSAAAPAYAGRDDRRGHAQRAPAGRDHHDWGRGYYAPPVVVAPPPAYGGYYAPPPVYDVGPGISIGINIP